MAGPPEYQMREQLGSGPSPGLHGLQAPSNPVVADRSSIGSALSGFGAELAHVVQKVKTGEQNTLASQGLESFIQKNYELRTKYSESADYQGAEVSFRDDIDQAKRDSLENIDDPAVRAQTAVQMERLAVASQGQVRAAQMARQKKINDEALTTVKKAAVLGATTASSPMERAAAVDMADTEISRMERSGWIDSRAAEAHVTDFGRTLDAADATAAIKANPGAAISALSEGAFPFLDTAQRGALFNAAYRTEAMNDSAATRAPFSNALDLTVAGTLTPEYVAAHAESLPAVKADALMRAASPDRVADTQPKVQASLLRGAVVDPEATIGEALSAYASGAIGQGDFGQIVALTRAVASDDVTRPWVNETRQRLAGLVAKRRDQDPASAARQAMAIPAFEQWLSDNPDAPQADIEAQAAGLAADSLMAAASHDVSTMPLPRFATMARGKIDVDHVSAIAERTLAARKDGTLSNREMIEQADLLARWNDALGQISKGTAP
jgi:hypothetical protein